MDLRINPPPRSSRRGVRRQRSGEHGSPDDPGYGFRLPPDGSPPTFRLLVSTRWATAGTLGALATLGAIMRWPHRTVPILGALVVLAASMLLHAVAQSRRLVVEQVALPVQDLPAHLDGLRIAHLSDFHYGTHFSARKLRRARTLLAQLEPHLIAITGDFVSTSAAIPELRAALANLRAPLGVFAVLGNHDYWVRVEQLRETLRDLEITVLDNAACVVDVNGDRLRIVGVDCVWEQRHDVALAFREHAGLPTLALAHEPDIADAVAPYAPMVQLSGHTHNGHLALPLLGPLFLPRHGFHYVRGLYRIGAMWLYVSRGLGGIPLRLGGAPEMAIITLRRG